MTMPEPLRCPECDGTTATHTVDALQVEVCQGCGGVWFGANQLKKVIADGAAALDELMGFEAKDAHAAPRHSTLTCPHCRIVLHRNQLAHSPDVQIDTCYGCGGLYLSAAGLAKLEEAAHHPAATTSKPATPAEVAAGRTLDVLIQNDYRRAQTMTSLINCQLGNSPYGNPYFKIAGI